MREVTQGRLDRYLRRAIMVRGEKAVDALLYGGPLDMRGLGRREHLKILRDFMTPKRPRENFRVWMDRKLAELNGPKP